MLRFYLNKTFWLFRFTFNLHSQDWLDLSKKIDNIFKKQLWAVSIYVASLQALTLLEGSFKP